MLDMSTIPSIRIIISVYKNTLYLSKVLDSLAIQKFQKFQVTVAEDGDSEVMKRFLTTAVYPFEIQHETQEDIGFRKNKILNQAIRNSKEELLIFLDGDCVLHPSYLEQCVAKFNENTVLFAKRVNVDSVSTKTMLQSKRCKPSFWSLFKNKANHIEDGFYFPWKSVKYTDKPALLGCNMVIPKKVLEAVNGFDEDYELPGYGEDSDIQWRIQKAGFLFIKMKFLLVQYHLFHERPSREDETAITRKLYDNKIKKRIVFCHNGLTKKA
jgi:GT2 family glycosyltransferase